MCSQVLRGMLDKIEREEKQEQKRLKKQETAEEKHKRLVANKLQGLLYKQKEVLKKDILKKRALMEKALHQDIQVRQKKRGNTFITILNFTGSHI